MFQDVSRTDFNEKMLWLGVLRRHLFDYVLYKGSGRHRRRWVNAKRFIFSKDVEDEVLLTFDEICALFGWEPDYIRRKVKELDRGDIKKIEAMKFKENFDGGTATFLESIRWAAGEGAVPFFAPYNYNREVRRRLQLRVVLTQRTPTFAPFVRWQSVSV